ncbi:MAG TPA: TIGR02530 family flagellar biosynthesis protein [Conexibacter sp.]|jgi:flagellar operon protein|nr:TIGR02530 family flagellar biosynthesis protein [Conexibacter sp.]
MSQPLPNAALLPPGIAGPQPAAPVGASNRIADAQAVHGPAFGELLARTHSVSFSRHALERLQRRGIELGEQTLARLGDGVDRAAGKGSRASVVFVDGTAFVVAVPKRTVVTAVDPEHMREQVFTNIDSAVIA